MGIYERWLLPRLARQMGFCTPTNLMQRTVTYLLDFKPPLAFIAVAGAAIMAMAALDPPQGSYLWLLIHTAASVNAIMAAFALLPAPGLPGADIWRGSKAFMVALILATAALFVALAMLTGAPVI